ncbi:MAG: metallophosphoesterase family protein [Anaerostipes hadrus]
MFSIFDRTYKVNEEEINILLAHQFVTANKKNPELSDSETSSLGGIDYIDFRIFDPFDYVALGHIHKPQAMGRDMVRYAGSILKYSFS